MKHGMQMEIYAPAAVAWMVHGEQFGEIAQWSSTLDESWLDAELGVGCRRVSRSSRSFVPFAPSVVSERLELFAREGMQLCCCGTDGIPSFKRAACSHWRVEALKWA